MLHIDDRPIRDDIAIHEISQRSIDGQEHVGITPTVPSNLMEERLDQGGETILPLKNGRQIEVRLGLATYQSLTRLFENDRHLFNALRSIAEGHSATVGPARTRALRHGLFLQQDLSIREPVRDVLLSAYQETAEGCILANPFKLDRPEQARMLEQLEKAGLDRIIRLLWNDEEGPSRE